MFSMSTQGSRPGADSTSPSMVGGIGGTHLVMPSRSAKSVPSAAARARSTSARAFGRQTMPCDSSPRSRTAFTRSDLLPASRPVSPSSSISSSGSTDCSGMYTALSPVRYAPLATTARYRPTWASSSASAFGCSWTVSTSAVTRSVDMAGLLGVPQLGFIAPNCPYGKGVERRILGLLCAPLEA